MINNIDGLKVKLIEYITTMTSEEGLKDIEQFIEVNTFYPKVTSRAMSLDEDRAPAPSPILNSVLDELERIELVKS